MKEVKVVVVVMLGLVLSSFLVVVAINVLAADGEAQYCFVEQHSEGVQYWTLRAFSPWRRDRVIMRTTLLPEAVAVADVLHCPLLSRGFNRAKSGSSGSDVDPMWSPQ
jgi:hypothetical protein